MTCHGQWPASVHVTLLWQQIPASLGQMRQTEGSGVVYFEFDGVRAVRLVEEVVVLVLGLGLGWDWGKEVFAYGEVEVKLG